MIDLTMAAGWRTGTIEEIAEKVAIGPFGSSIKVETFVPIIGGYSHGGSDLDLVLYALDLEEILISQLFGLEEALRLSTILSLVEALDWARLPESFAVRLRKTLSC